MPKIITKEQWEHRIRDAGAGRYEFVRWAVDGGFGIGKKCVVRCIFDEFEWEARAGNLVNSGTGCPHCAGNRRWSERDYINRINSTKSVTFNGFVSKFINAHSRVFLKCSIDGFEWESSINDVVNGRYGCPNCAGNRRYTRDEYISKINENEKLSFLRWDGEFKGNSSRAFFKCNLDGFVWSSIISSVTTSLTGCPKCAKYGFQIDITGYLYALRSDCGRYVKVGISNYPNRRHKELEKRTPFEFKVVEQFSGDGSKIAAMERHFHSKYERAGFTGFDGATEWLICTPQLLEELRELEDVK
jgi:hypothetical protein